MKISLKKLKIFIIKLLERLSKLISKIIYNEKTLIKKQN